MQVTIGESFSNDDFKELVDFPKRIATITEIMDQFIENDINVDKNSMARRSVIDAMSCYRKLLAERNKKRQTKFYDFFPKRITNVK